MISSVLDCPQCHHRFGFDCEGEFPEQIVCPECGRNRPYEDYSALIFCTRCRTKLKVPLDLLSEETLPCPQCGENVNLKVAIAGDVDYSTLTLGGTEVRDKKMLQDGDFIDKYKILRLLGKGGMAEVYLAEHLLLKKYCAIKVMRDNMDSNDEIRIKRFIREAKLAHQINHPNIIKVFDVGNDSKTGYMFLAMEYVEGSTLLDLCKENPLPEEDLLEIAEEMAQALNILHQANVVHRDIKPSNIMKTKEGLYKLMDLGIAKAGDASVRGELTLTVERSAIGTPSYASPEQCRSAHNADIRSDIYCLGATLYHLATGKLPFEGTSSVEIILKVMRDEPVPVEKIRPDLSGKMIYLIRQMMKKNPVHRPQSPEEILQILHGKRSLPGKLSIQRDPETEMEMEPTLTLLSPEKKKPREVEPVEMEEGVLPAESAWDQECYRSGFFFLRQRGVFRFLFRTGVIFGSLLLIGGNVVFLLRFYGNEMREDGSYDERISLVRNVFGKYFFGTHTKVNRESHIGEKRYSSGSRFFPIITFNVVNLSSDFIPDMVKDGALCMDGVFPSGTKNMAHPAYNYRNANSVFLPDLNPQEMAVSIDCKIHPDNKGSLLVCGIQPFTMSLDRENGKLVFNFSGNDKVETDLILPVNEWFNLIFHCDQRGNCLRVLYNQKPVGNYSFPLFLFPDRRFSFYNYHKQTAFHGQVDNLHIAHGPFSTVFRVFTSYYFHSRIRSDFTESQ